MDERIYSLLLRVFPRAFREDFELRLMELFRYRREDARRRGGPLWAVRFWAFMSADLIRSAWVCRSTARDSGRKSSAPADAQNCISRSGAGAAGG